MADHTYRADMDAVGKLFKAKAVAIVGATPDLTKLGSSAIVAMHNLGYQGEIYAVNPRYTEMMGHPCVGSIADLPDHVEAAMLNIPAEAAIAAVGKGFVDPLVPDAPLDVAVSNRRCTIDLG